MSDCKLAATIISAVCERLHRIFPDSEADFLPMFMQVPDARGSTALQRIPPVGEKVMRAGYRPVVLLATALVANCGGTGGHQTTNPVSTTQGTYVPGQSSLALGEPYFDLFYIVTYGCQLN